MSPPYSMGRTSVIYHPCLLPYSVGRPSVIYQQILPYSEETSVIYHPCPTIQCMVGHLLYITHVSSDTLCGVEPSCYISPMSPPIQCGSAICDISQMSRPIQCRSSHQTVIYHPCLLPYSVGRSSVIYHPCLLHTVWVGHLLYITHVSDPYSVGRPSDCYISPMSPPIQCRSRHLLYITHGSTPYSMGRRLGDI